MGAFALAAEFASFAGALVSVVATVISALVSRTLRARKLAETRKTSLELVLDSNDIRQLGNFLDETVGQFDVSEYVSSNDVAETIDEYFEGVIKFLDASETTIKADSSEPTTEEEFVREGRFPHSNGLPSQNEASGPFKKIVSELEEGEIWNALARLRRLIEIRLRERALKFGFSERHLRSGGQMLRLLADRKKIDSNVVGSLRYAIAICNKAVHGQEVSMSQAEEVVWIAQSVLTDLDA